MLFFRCWILFKCDCNHRDLHVRTYSFPTRRSSDRAARMPPPAALDLEPPPRYNSRSAVAYASRTSLFLIVASSRMRSEEDTTELQALMRISYAVFGLKKKFSYRYSPLAVI